MNKPSREGPSPEEPFRGNVEKRISRLRRAEKERRGLLAEAAPLGVLGLVIALPVVAGAYLGRWLDGLNPGYTTRWSVSMIFVGLMIGGFNAYKYLARR